MTGTAAAAIAAGDGPATQKCDQACRGNPRPSRRAKRCSRAGLSGARSGGGQGHIGRARSAVAACETAYDLSLEHPRCIFQLMKKHYSRYTPEMVSRITGIPRSSVSRPGTCSPPSVKTET